MSSIDAKREAIAEHFASWEAEIEKTRELLESPHFHLEGWLVASCHIGAMASARYPKDRDGQAFVKFVTNYTSDKKFWQQIDLLFLYQWPTSKYQGNGRYTAFDHYHLVLESIKPTLGDIDDLTPTTRFVDPETIEHIVREKCTTKISGSDLAAWLSLFSVAEELYRYVRCEAVHARHFPFVTQVNRGREDMRYEPNHVITSHVILSTVREALATLKAECVGNAKWPETLE